MDKGPINFRIKINENGPYLVTGGVPITRRIPAKSIYGEPLEWDPIESKDDEQPVGKIYLLCRCGQSANKPFCDDSHIRLGFDGTLTADRKNTAERRESFQGTGFNMTDDTSLCTSAGFCGTRWTNVWKMIEHTDDPEIKARLLRMVAFCPSGRLEVAFEDGELLEPEFVPSIAAVPDGPLWVRGKIPVVAPDGFTYEVRNRMTLCRCGQSKNKPFCDGMHEEIEFKAP